jgi:hypothetical protein
MPFMGGSVKLALRSLLQPCLAALAYKDLSPFLFPAFRILNPFTLNLSIFQLIQSLIKNLAGRNKNAVRPE